MTHRRVPADEIESRPVEVRTADGFALAARVHEGGEEPRANVIVHSATAVPQTYYEPFARYLAARGLRVVTYDYRGVGGSRPESLVGFAARMTEWATLDARAILAMVRERFSHVPTFFVGHSFGGQMIGILDELREAEGAIVVASQLGYYGHWPLLSRMRLAFMWYVVEPLVTSTFGYLPSTGLLGVELPAGVAREWSAWCRHPEYLLGYVEGARERFARFDRPILFYSFTDDELAPEPSVAALLGALPRRDRIHRRVSPGELGVEGLGHFGFFRESKAAALWPEVVCFVDAVAAGERPPLPDSPAPGERAGVALDWAEVMSDLEAGRA